MSACIIDGKLISTTIKNELADKVNELKQKGILPTLAVILVGENPASKVYVNNKKKSCETVGIQSLSFEIPEETTEEQLLSLIHELNERVDVHGILCQLPLPKHIDENKIIEAIDPTKDVDGFHPINVGKLSIGQKGFVSCTPAGVIELLKRTGISIQGKNCVIVGRSNIVGKPMALLLLREHGTVTICHSRTQDLKSVCQSADILVVAIGIPEFITGEYIKKDAIVIDVGMNRKDNGKLCGDVLYEEASHIASHITPVPGGVGPMTIAMLMNNCVESATRLLKK